VKLFCLILFLAIGATPGCSHFSSSARQQRAYAKYVRKSSFAHQKRHAQFRQEKARIPQQDDAAQTEQISMETQEGPQAVPGESNSE
jgi:hypothetical protein